jgi:integrase
LIFDKGIYQRSKFGYKWVRFVIFYFLGGAVNLGDGSSLTPASINHILKRLQKQAGLNQIGELSGHSFRVGAALDQLNKNVPLEKIMLRGGWKSETSAMRYLQSWNDNNWLIIN